MTLLCADYQLPNSPCRKDIEIKKIEQAAITERKQIDAGKELAVEKEKTSRENSRERQKKIELDKEKERTKQMELVGNSSDLLKLLEAALGKIQFKSAQEHHPNIENTKC